MKLRKLAWLCKHDKLAPHWIGRLAERCPGGEFLADEVLVVEKVNGEWPEWAIMGLASSLGGTPGRGLAQGLLDSLMESFGDELGIG